MEKISVLMPVFNREKYIKESIESILNQTYKNLEIIIYDDGSTDNSVQIIKEIAKTDKRIKLIEGKVNKGVAYARNQLLNLCNTKYACWQDSDDISRPNRIKLQYNEISKENALIFCGWNWLVWQSKGKWHRKIAPYNVKASPTLMFPVNKTIKFDPNQKIGGEDWTWIAKMLKIYKNKIVIPYILYYLRFHEDRIGTWKIKIRRTLSRELQEKLSYKEMIDYYKEHYEK